MIFVIFVPRFPCIPIFMDGDGTIPVGGVGDHHLATVPQKCERTVARASGGMTKRGEVVLCSERTKSVFDTANTLQRVSAPHSRLF